MLVKGQAPQTLHLQVRVTNPFYAFDMLYYIYVYYTYILNYVYTKLCAYTIYTIGHNGHEAVRGQEPRGAPAGGLQEGQQGRGTGSDTGWR